MAETKVEMSVAKLAVLMAVKRVDLWELLLVVLKVAQLVELMAMT
jgi:hypothetical protein